MHVPMPSVPQKPTTDPEIPSNPAFGEKVRQARKAKKWSQWDLARALTPSVTQATISEIERGQGSSSAILGICRLLGVDPPLAGASPELARWIEVGRILARFPEVFEYHLRQLEALAMTLARAPAHPDPERPRTPRH